MQKQYDVYGIGSALMDFLIEADEELLKQFNLIKGNMHLIDEQQSVEFMKKVKEYNMKIAPGGSSANTLAGISQLGGKVVFCGKVGDDENGYLYEKKTVESNIKSNISKGNVITGHTITFITPDSERTFATHLGAAMQLTKEDLFEEDIKDSKILHVEGYQLEDPNLRATTLHAMSIAKANNTKISIDLADPALVSRNKDDLKSIVTEYADIVFANEEEAKAFTGKDGEAALIIIAKMAEIAIVKLGAKGSWIQKGPEKTFIAAHKVNAVDTTGAGDMFAAGFLYGYSKDMDLEQCGKIGSYIASLVVSQIGARLDTIPTDFLKNL
ncbi:MAG: adenosine kinase [Nanoarchaeota archaeon]|nr:adenosine kinase [Nanoarchaeota archaeon]